MRIVTTVALVCATALAAHAAPPVGWCGGQNGWAFLRDQLHSSGMLTQKQIATLFNDRRMPHFTGISFSVRAAEAASLYTKFSSEERIARARQFISRHTNVFSRASKKYPVPAAIITAIMLVESDLGRAAGRERVAYRIARLAAASCPDNINDNHERLAREDASVTVADVTTRATKLQKAFSRQLADLFVVATRRHTHPLAIKGSYAGAFGLPQFMPSAYVSYAVDGNSDGVVSLYSIADAVFSVANYLRANGWKTQSVTRATARKVLWSYNHSTPYGEAVLDVATRLDPTIVTD